MERLVLYLIKKLHFCSLSLDANKFRIVYYNVLTNARSVSKLYRGILGNALEQDGLLPSAVRQKETEQSKSVRALAVLVISGFNAC